MADGNDINLHMTSQISALPTGWEMNPEVFKQILDTHEFVCEFEEGDERCSFRGHATDKVMVSDGNRKRGEAAFWVVEIAIVTTKMDERGRPLLWPDGSAKTSRKLLERWILHRTHARRVARSARESGLQIKEYPLHNNLTHLSNRAYEQKRGPMVAAFFLAYAKGEVGVEAGRELGCVKPVPEDREAICHYLSRGTEIVGVVPDSDKDAYFSAHKADRQAFLASGTYLFHGPAGNAERDLEERSKRAAEYAVREARRKEEESKRSAKAAAHAAKVEASKQALAAKYAAIAASVGLTMSPSPTEDRRPKGRDKRRDGPKPPRKPQMVASARKEINEGTALAIELAAETAAPEPETVEPSEASPPRLSVPMLEAVRRTDTSDKGSSE